MIKISNRVSHLQETFLRRLSIECDQRKGINLAQGIINTSPPQIILSAARKAVKTGQNTYTTLLGNENLRQAISRKLLEYNNLSYNPKNEIVITVGAAGAFYCVCLGLLNPGDEILVFEPFYPYHIDVLISLGIKPSYIKLIPPEWNFDPNELRKKINKNTKAILINSPSNPSGKVFNLKELISIAEIADVFDLTIITDEVYEYFTYGENKHISPASVHGLESRTITISSFSKTFAITGWRIGYIACKPEIAQAMAYINERIFICAPSVLQSGVADGIFSLSNNYYAQLKESFQSKLNKLTHSLQMANLYPIVPDGTFYILADIGRMPGGSGFEKAMNLLEKTSVACAPCSAFILPGSNSLKNYARFSFGVSDEKLEEACKRIERL